MTELGDWQRAIQSGQTLADIEISIRKQPDCRVNCIREVIAPPPPSSSAPQIAQAYLKYLGRPADPSEIAAWEARVRSGELTLVQVLGDIQNSFEARLRAVYIYHLQKELDFAGKEYWYGLYLQGHTFDQIRNFVRETPICKVDCISQN